MKWLLGILVVGVVFVVLSWNEGQLRSQLDKEGKTVAGTIIGGESKAGRRGYHRLEALYHTEQGLPYRNVFDVSTKFFNEHSSGNTIINEQVEVCYLPSNPETAVIVGSRYDNRWMFWPGILIILASIGGLAFAFISNFTSGKTG